MKINIHSIYKAGKATGIVYSVDGTKCSTFVPSYYAARGTQSTRLYNWIRDLVKADEPAPVKRLAIVRMPNGTSFRKALKRAKALGGTYHADHKQWVVEVPSTIDWSREDMVFVSWLDDDKRALYAEWGTDAPVSIVC